MLKEETEQNGFLSATEDSIQESATNLAEGRLKWSSKLEFILTSIGYCVGLGNLWRFPYLCYTYGGGAFLIPYFLVTVLCAFPLVVFELYMGQYVGLGVLSFWNICPIFKGIGISDFLVSGTVVVYYAIIVSYSLHYFFASFARNLPWISCGNKWNTADCSSDAFTNHSHFNKSANPYESSLNRSLSGLNGSSLMQKISPAEEYLNHRVLKRSGGIDEIGTLQWELVLCLILAWLLILVITIKGIKTGGKAVYFTATFPYVVLTVLLIQGAMQDGAIDGIYYFLVPQWHMLQDSKIWYSAAMQVFYSLGPGSGIYITMASYNDFDNNIVRDAVIFTSVNCLTSLFAGSVVFTFLGAMSHNLQVPISEITESGPALAFVAYPTAIATMPIPQLWAVCFFFMISLIGFSSLVCNYETVATAIVDSFPKLRSTRNRALLGVGLTTFFCLCGLVFVTEGGLYIFTIVDWYAYTIVVILIAITEFTFCWIHGFDKIFKAVHEMLGKEPNHYFKLSWRFISPILLILIFIMTLISWSPPTVGSYVFPVFADVIGWSITSLLILPLPVMCVWGLYAAEGETFKQKWNASINPTDSIQKHIKMRSHTAFQEKKACLQRLDESPL